MNYKLEMVRGRRTVLIGYFPSDWRADEIATLLGWEGSWTRKITRVN